MSHRLSGNSENGFDNDFGPLYLLPVDRTLMAGGYEFNCRLLDPATGETLTLDVNPFDIR